MTFNVVIKQMLLKIVYIWRKICHLSVSLLLFFSIIGMQLQS